MVVVTKAVATSIIWIAFIAVVAMTTMTDADTVLHVSPHGMDDNPGTAESPLATLEGARQRVRQVRVTGEAVTIEFAAGTYWFERPVNFDGEDSGTANGRITYRAATGQEVRFSGGRQVTEWSAVTDTGVRGRLLQEALPHVRVADLRQQGITDYGELSTRGHAIHSEPAEAELFWNDEPMMLSRWPNEGFHTATALDGIQRVTVDTDRVERWVEESDPWVFAYWFYDWTELYEPIVDIDSPNRVLVRSSAVEPRYGIDPKRTRWYGLNLLSELDLPGEYYLDRDNGLLYFWPPASSGTAVLSMAAGFVRADELSHVTFHGMMFEVCRATAITMNGGMDTRIVGCTIRSTGHAGIRVSGGVNHEVYGCDIYHCGEGGISMSGGDRPSLEPARHNAENNHVYRYSRRARTYNPAISVFGVGCRIAHNLIHDGPHMALGAGGNDHVLEYNEIHHVVYESGDAGAFYVGRDWTQRGTVLRYNYWHDIAGAGGLGGMTIYLDDQQSGHIIHGNLFERTSHSIFIGGGDDNIVTNNVFIDSRPAAHIDNRGMGWQKEATDDEDGTLRTRLRAMPYQGNLWSERYPTLPGILEDEPNIPKRNVFRRNISAGGQWDDIHSGTRRYQTIEDNLAFDGDTGWITVHRDGAGRPLQLEFADPQAVADFGFEPLPLEMMGLYEDERRARPPGSTVVDDEDGVVPQSFELGDNFPNPFNTGTMIPYTLSVETYVSMVVYNLAGQRIRALTAGGRPAGWHDVHWDGNNSSGDPVATGVYVIHLRAGGFTQARKVLLLR